MTEVFFPVSSTPLVLLEITRLVESDLSEDGLIVSSQVETD